MSVASAAWQGLTRCRGVPGGEGGGGSMDSRDGLGKVEENSFLRAPVGLGGEGRGAMEGGTTPRLGGKRGGLN